MSRDQDLQKVMWISLGHGLRTVDRDQKKPWIIFCHGSWSRVESGPHYQDHNKVNAQSINRKNNRIESMIPDWHQRSNDHGQVG